MCSYLVYQTLNIIFSVVLQHIIHRYNYRWWKVTSNKSPHIPLHFVAQKGDQYSSSLKQLEAISAMKTGTIWNFEK